MFRPAGEPFRCDGSEMKADMACCALGLLESGSRLPHSAGPYNGGMVALAAVRCAGCGSHIPTDAPGDACLDERGFAHVVCEMCGAETAYLADGEVAGDARSIARRMVMSRIAIFALWLVILGLILLLLPIYWSFEQGPEPTNPVYFV